MGKLIGGLLALFITMPIWYFLLYRVLQSVNASELMWFLYWIYLPVGVLVQTLVQVSKE